MRRILVIEDEFLVAANIDFILVQEGHEVIGPVGTLGEALQLANDEALDCALLDVNLDGGRVDDVAAILDRRGVPFIFVTGYGRDNLPPNFRDTVIVDKPFRDQDLLRGVQRLVMHSSVRESDKRAK
jgi:CheY-like chemotaxis protein